MHLKCGDGLFPIELWPLNTNLWRFATGRRSGTSHKYRRALRPLKRTTLMIDIDSPPLAPLCATCGTELMLTPSGHRFCADPVCTEGFGTNMLRQLFGGAIDTKPINFDRKRSR